MVLIKLNPVQERIIRDVCHEQILSYHTLALEGHPEFAEVAKKFPNEETEQIILKYLLAKKEKFEKVHTDPSRVLTILDELERMNFFYTLTRMDELYRQKFPKSLLNLWQQLSNGDEFQLDKEETLNSLN